MSVKDQFMQATADHQATWYTAQRVKLPDDVSAWLDDKEGQCAKLWNNLPPEVETEYREGMSRNISKARELLSGQNIDDLKYYVYLVLENFKRMDKDVRLYRNDKGDGGRSDGGQTGAEIRKAEKAKRKAQAKEIYKTLSEKAEHQKAAIIAKRMGVGARAVRGYLKDIVPKK